MTTSPLPPLPLALRKRGIALRAETEADLAFARAVYGDHRAAELARSPLPDEAKARFLDDQFRLQRAHFLHEYPAADFLIIAQATAPVGRLYLDRAAACWQLIEITLAPSAQGSGLGAALIGWMQRAAPAIALHVARDNPRAEALYRRCGFAEIFATSPTHKAMRWQR